MSDYWDGFNPWGNDARYGYQYQNWPTYPTNPPNEGLTLAEAVQKLKDNGGAIRRPRWEDVLALDSYSGKLKGYCDPKNSMLQAETLLATDWIWKAGNE